MLVANIACEKDVGRYVPNTIKRSVWQSSRLTCINIFAQSSHGKSVTNAIEFSRLAVPFKITALASA